MNFEKVVDTIYTAWEDTLPRDLSHDAAYIADKKDPGLAPGAKPTPTFCLLGPPGIGKTSIGEAVFARMQERMSASPHSFGRLHVIDLTSADPVDFAMPLPVDTDEGKVLSFAHKDWLVEMSRPGAYGVVILDDLPAASQAIQAATRQFSLFRSINGRQVTSRIVIIVTGNRRGDQSGASQLPAHFRNTTVMLDLEPSLMEFTEWYLRQSLDPSIAAFLTWKKSYLSQTPDKAANGGSFATPRSWAMLGRLVGSARRSKTLLAVSKGLVGDGYGAEFYAFDSLRDELADPAKVLDEPRRHVPDPRGLASTPDRYLSLITGLAEESVARIKALPGDAAQKQRGAVDQTVAFLHALAWVSQHSPDYSVAGVTMWHGLGGAVTLLADAGKRAGMEDPITRAYIDKLRASLWSKPKDATSRQ